MCVCRRVVVFEAKQMVYLKLQNKGVCAWVACVTYNTTDRASRLTNDKVGQSRCGKKIKVRCVCVCSSHLF